MTYLDEILEARSKVSLGTNRYIVLKNRMVVFSSNMSGKTLKVVGNVCNDKTITSVPDRMQLAAVYWVLHRWYANQENANRANYYLDLYRIEWEKTRHNRMGSAYCSIGDSL